MTTKERTTKRSRGPVSSEKAFTIERTFKTTLERMWAMWTTKEGVESWWSPEGFAIRVLTFDLRPGGAFDFEHIVTAPDQVAWNRERGLPLTLRVHNSYLEVVKPRRLAFTTRIDFVPGVEPYDFTSTADFVKVKGGTKVVFTSSKMHSEEWGELARQGQMSEFDHLARVLEG